MRAAKIATVRQLLVGATQIALLPRLDAVVAVLRGISPDLPDNATLDELNEGVSFSEELLDELCDRFEEDSRTRHLTIKARGRIAAQVGAVLEAALVRELVNYDG